MKIYLEKKMWLTTQISDHGEMITFNTKSNIFMLTLEDDTDVTEVDARIPLYSEERRESDSLQLMFNTGCVVRTQWFPKISN